MPEPKVIIVLLRRPRSPKDMRSDPFWECGSFGCTTCHSKNLMSPTKKDEIEGARLAFTQGGPSGLRLVLLTPPITVRKHRNCCEAQWRPARMPFRYNAAPLVMDNDGKSDFPFLKRFLMKLLADGNRHTLVGQFSSQFRSRREPLPATIAWRLVASFDQVCRRAARADFATSYEQALPDRPPKIDRDRKGTLRRLRQRANAKANRKLSCVCKKGKGKR